MIIEGSISVKAAINGKRRDIFTVYVDESKKDKDIKYIESRCKEDNISFEYISKEEISKLATGKTHGGIIAEAGPRRYQDINDTLGSNSFVVLIEGVEDPFNLGYMMRSLYSAGCTGILLKERDWGLSETTILKSSAGAYEFIPIIMSNELDVLIDEYKSKGFMCYVAMRNDAIEYYDANFNQDILIGIGGEMRGLSSKVKDKFDQNIYIPYANDFRNSLNAAGACAAIGFEVMRQRRIHNA